MGDISANWSWRETGAGDHGALVVDPLHRRRSVHLVETLLQPARDVVGPMKATSWYRPGDHGSLHGQGAAADVVPLEAPRMMLWGVLLGLARAGRVFHELIVYEDTGHIHVGARLEDERNARRVRVARPAGGTLPGSWKRKYEYIPWERYDGPLRSAS